MFVSSFSLAPSEKTALDVKFDTKLPSKYAPVPGTETLKAVYGCSEVLLLWSSRQIIDYDLITTAHV